MWSAFRHLGMLVCHFRLLVMKATSPRDRKTYFFVDKCLPFGAAISCAHFQDFSNAIAHIITFQTGKDLVNYLDDFLFLALLRVMCDRQIQKFLDVCKDINFPVSMEKMLWSEMIIVFLGLLIDAVRKVICVPQEKIDKALQLIDNLLQASKHKATVYNIQKLCGLLNFMGRAIVPGRAFTRRLYSIPNGQKRKDGTVVQLKQHHHVRLTSENLQDLRMWKQFLTHPSAYFRSFMDFTRVWTAEEVKFFTDASKNSSLGCGGWSDTDYYYTQWDSDFILQHDPSIAYLELHAVTVGVKLWLHKYKNRCIIIGCDNQAVVQMLNNMTISCKNCMQLIRIIVLESLVHNVRLYTKYIESEQNEILDALSHLQFARFNRLTARMNMSCKPDDIPCELWPMTKLWND